VKGKGAHQAAVKCELRKRVPMRSAAVAVGLRRGRGVVVVVFAFVSWLRRILKIKRPCPAVIGTSASPRQEKHK